ncbi:Molecular chaperone DnaK (HSP70) [Ectothiorhodospira magna]|uniref:Molecular chaperone DnaK (HSP70) n=1 Tax=Ectothiorhodospira magna TaxID=867345 RepID=A0A1H9CMA2_9GAMM|nr:Hsp70 family protein [Ectothiorhodospira magna]SEQ02294.1 Molecular chaperone DnaK (HSP70) [Ectothiorhodospira magna]
MTHPIIGIDLGTTNSEVAVIRNGTLEHIPVDGALLMPSVVGLDDDGNLLVGQAARNQYALHPERTIRSVKRRMGEDIKITLGWRQYTPQEISALILGRLKQAAEDHLGQAVHQAVITVPAYFSDAQRQATRDAGTLAGLDVVRIINEPTAAALARESGGDQRKTVLVYDLGGGTFDVSVVRLEKDVVEVLSSHGNNHLGGDDFDNLILEQLMNWLRTEKGVDPSLDAHAMARLVRAAETAKVRLSDAPHAQVREEYLLEDDDGPVHLDLELERQDYEAMIEPLVAETLSAVHTALEGAQLTVSDLDEVFLVGGATRTPLIQRHLEDMLGLQPRAEMDPELCVAIGAATQAAMIAGEKVNSLLLDVTPYTFGTSAIDTLNGEIYPHVFFPLIRKNTPIPVTKSEVFYTTHDYQEIVEVNVYQGEDRDALNNTQIGVYRIEGLSRVPSGNAIVTTFSLDLNGILHVSSVEKRTGKEVRITIDNATQRFEQDEMEAARSRLQALTAEDANGTGTHDGQQRRHVEAKALIEKAERLLGKAGAEDREDLVDAMETLRDALTSEDAAALEAAMATLSDLIFYLES